MPQDISEIIKEYEPIIRKIAQSTCYSSRAIDINDLLQVGKIAVLRAIRSYNPSYGANIKSFITCSVRREIYSEAAKFLGVFTVDKRVTAQASKINRLSKDGLSDSEISVLLKKTEDQVRDLRLSYERRGSISVTDYNVLDKEQLYTEEIHELLLKLNINQEERFIIFSRILGRIPVKHVAEYLKISPSRVYELEKNIKEHVVNAIGLNT